MSTDDDFVEYYTARLSRGDDFLGEIIPDVFGGRLAGMAMYARKVLAKFGSAGVFKILDAGDAMLDMYIGEGFDVQRNGQSVPLTRDVLPEIDEMFLLRVVATDVSEHSNRSPSVHRPVVTFQEFCTAVALGHILRATIHPTPEWFLGEGGRYALLAADALSIGISELIGDIWAKQKRSEHLSNAAHASHARRAAQIAKPNVYQEWERWQSGQVIYKSGADFANKMIAQFDPAVRNPKTIEKWCGEWREKRKALAHHSQLQSSVPP